MNATTSKTDHGSTSDAGLLTRQEACEFLKIKPRTLDDWRTQKAVPCIERGRWIRFRRSDLEAFIEAHTIKVDAAFFRPRRRAQEPAA